MPSLWEKVKDWLEDTTEQALKEAEDLTRRGRLKMKIFSLHRAIKENFTELGGTVYQLLSRKANVIEDERVREIVDKIKGLEEELAKKEREWKELKGKRG